MIINSNSIKKLIIKINKNSWEYVLCYINEYKKLITFNTEAN